MKHTFRALLLSAAVAVIGTAGSAQEVLKATWTDPDDPSEAPVTAYMHVLKESVESLAGDEFTVELYPNGQLGDQRSMVQQVSRGSLHFANVASGVLASLYYPELGIVDLPYLYRSRAHFRAAMDPADPYISKLLDDIAEETGVRVLSLHPYGFRSLTTKGRAVHTPDDMKGLRIRTMEVVPHQQMMQAMGATPVPIPYLELYTSLQTGVVDGQENTPSNVLMQKFFQVQDHMTMTQQVMTVGAVITNEEWWQSLSDEQRREFREADAEASLAHDGIGAIKDLVGLQQIRDEGIDVYVPTPEEMQAFRDATVEPGIGKARDEYGSDFVDGFMTHMAEVDKIF